MATVILKIDNLLVQYDDANFYDTFDETVGGTNPGQILRKTDNKVYLRSYHNGVLKFLANIVAISATLTAVGNMDKVEIK